jgi:quercetin dioxygenase-like cupin family protein
MKLLFCTIILQILIIGCSNQRNQTYPPVFSKGTLAPSENFTGNAWVLPFVTADSIYTTVTGHVLFEAGARSNWHSHPSGQILIVTAGVGYHQVKGEPKQVIKKGDVVKCPPNAVHWHGASRDSSMSHIYLVPNTEKGVVDWMEPVSEAEFLK